MKIGEIKKQTSLSLEGVLFKSIIMTLLYTIINLLAQFALTKLGNLFTNFNTLFLIIQIVINTALIPFSYSLIVSLIELTKDNSIGITNFINVGLLNYTKIIKLFFRMFLKILPYVILFFITLILMIIDFGNAAISTLFTILFIINVVVLIIKALDFVLILFINYDDSKLSAKEIINKSKSLMQKNKLKYILLVFSFILWFILLALVGRILSYFIPEDISLYILNACFSIITPSITISQYIFYDSLANTNQVK